jgi:hypothetical protein
VKEHRVIAVPKPRDEIDLPKLARVILELVKREAAQEELEAVEPAEAS